MTEQVEQWICIKFCIKLEHPSPETVWMIQKATAMATGNWQLHHDNVPAHVSHLVQFFGETSNHSGDSAPLQPTFGVKFCLSPKLKSPLKGRRFQLINEIQENMTSSWWRLGELCEVPRCLLWRELRRHCPPYSVSSYFVSSSINVYFSYYMAGYFLDRLHMSLFMSSTYISISIFLGISLFYNIYTHLWPISNRVVITNCVISFLLLYF